MKNVEASWAGLIQSCASQLQRVSSTIAPPAVIGARFSTSGLDASKCRMSAHVVLTYELHPDTRPLVVNDLDKKKHLQDKSIFVFRMSLKDFDSHFV